MSLPINKRRYLYQKVMALVFTFTIISCGNDADNSDADNVAANKPAALSKAKETPEVRKMLAAFKQQEHRIELNGCEMLYNGTPFKLGMTVKELVDVFGQYDVFYNGRFIWKDQGIILASKIVEEKLDNKLVYMYLYMNTVVDEEDRELLRHKLNRKKDYFLLEGVPISHETRIVDFFSNSTFELNDFSVSDWGYASSYECQPVKVGYMMYSKGNWIYKGGGHLRLKSHLNKSNTSKIELIEIEPQ